MAVDIFGTLEGNLGFGSLLLGDAAADLLVETLDLVELGGTGALTTGLLLADLVGLSNEFLASLLGRVGLVLVLVGQGNVDLGLDGVLFVELERGFQGSEMSVQVFLFFFCPFLYTDATRFGKTSRVSQNEGAEDRKKKKAAGVEQALGRRQRTNRSMDALWSFSALARASLKAFSSGRVGRAWDSAAGA